MSHIEAAFRVMSHLAVLIIMVLAAASNEAIHTVPRNASVAWISELFEVNYRSLQKVILASAMLCSV
jgi:hypothetical protein